MSGDTATVHISALNATVTEPIVAPDENLGPQDIALDGIYHFGPSTSVPSGSSIQWAITYTSSGDTTWFCDVATTQTPAESLIDNSNSGVAGTTTIGYLVGNGMDSGGADAPAYFNVYNNSGFSTAAMTGVTVTYQIV